MAREQWLGGCDPEKLERFTTATEVLYVAFAHDWMGDDHSLATAFHLVRGSLAEDGGDWGYRHLEVSVVYPHRAK